MKAILLGIVIAAVVGLGSAWLLAENQRTAYESFATPSVRVGIPGDNLVGPEWNTDDAGPDDVEPTSG